MALLLKKPAAPIAAPVQKAVSQPLKPLGKPTPIGFAPAVKKAPHQGMQLAKRGANAAAIMHQEEAAAEQRSKNNVFRFWLKPKDDGAVTFLDGNIVDGFFDNVFTYEHGLKVAGKYTNFLCIGEEEPCPICIGGNRNDYVAYFTVIDHAKYISKKDGKEHADNKRLFVAKRGTIKILLKLALKRGGSLRGIRVDVSRTGDKEANVGNVFDFTEKYSEIQLQAMYPEGKDKLNSHVPVDYEEMMGAMYMDGKSLRKFGFGTTQIGDEDAPEDSATEDMSSKL